MTHYTRACLTPGGGSHPPPLVSSAPCGGCCAIRLHPARGYVARKPVQTPDGVVTSWSQALANGCSCVGFLRLKNSEFVGKLINRWVISDQLVTGLNWKGRDQGENECGNIEQNRVCLPSWSL